MNLHPPSAHYDTLAMALPPPPILVTQHIVSLGYQGEHLAGVQRLISLGVELLGHVEVC